MYDIADCEANIYNTHMTNVSRKKCDHRMKSDHLIEFDMRNIFLEKSCKKCGGEASPRHFCKK